MSNDQPAGAHHEEMWALIPWLVNGSLSGEAAAPLSAHLGHCEECAREYALQLRIQEGMQPDESIAFASDASFQKLAMRLDAASKVRPISPKLRSYAAAGVLAALGLAGWSAWSVHRAPASPTAAYHTLTSSAALVPSGAQVRVVFQPNLTLSELARLLHSIDANITDGPTEAGVYTLGFAPSRNSSAQVSQRLALLRANDNVRFAEPVFGAP